ncbi:MAG: hypothetical protein WC779_08190 [Candidatus Omnitrophota bacterium]|jgi:hypothetical protein
MIIVLFFVALIGFAVYRKVSEDEGFLPALAGVIGLGICLLAIFINGYIGGESNVVAYYQDKAQIEAAISNPHITATERNAAIELAVEDNTIITTAKRWYKDPFIGWFRQAAIVDLPLFDISKIPSADSAITITK